MISPSADAYYNLKDNEIEDLIFTKDIVDNMLLYSKTIHVIGIVSSCEVRKSVFKFTLCNRSTEVIQCIIWDESTIEKWQPLIVPGNILHLDAAFARPRYATMSAGNIPYDLNIMSNTVIRLIKERPSSTTPTNINFVMSTIEDCCKHESHIEIKAFIKNPIMETSLPSMKINQGCLSDCTLYKLEIRMPSLCDMSKYVVGSHVKANGVIKYGQHPYLWVLRQDDICFASDQIKSVTELLKGRKMPKRLHSSQEDQALKSFKAEK